MKKYGKSIVEKAKEDTHNQFLESMLSGKADITKYLFIKKFKNYALMRFKGIAIVGVKWVPLFWRINKKVKTGRKMQGKRSKLVVLDDLYDERFLEKIENGVGYVSACKFMIFHNVFKTIKLKVSIILY